MAIGGIILAVQQDATGQGKALALAYGAGVGCARAGIVETTSAVSLPAEATMIEPRAWKTTIAPSVASKIVLSRTIESVQLDEALNWIADRAAKGPSKKKSRGRGGFKKKAVAPKGDVTTAAIKPAKKKAAKKKAAKKKSKPT